MPAYDELANSFNKINHDIANNIIINFKRGDSASFEVYHFMLQQLKVIFEAIEVRFFELELQNDPRFSLMSRSLIFAQHAIKNDLALVANTLNIKSESVSQLALYFAEEIKHFNTDELMGVIIGYSIHANETHKRIKEELLNSFQRKISEPHHGLSYYIHSLDVKVLKDDIEKYDNNTLQHCYTFYEKLTSIYNLSMVKLKQLQPSKAHGLFSAAIKITIGIAIGQAVIRYGINS